MQAGQFDAYAVTTRSGPHVTVQAGVVHLGRHWTTATRNSVKARSINRLHRAAITTGEGPSWRVVGGRAQVLDGARPMSLAASPVTSALAGGAMLRVGLRQLDQLVGYAEVGAAVPLSFLPTGRVLLVTRIQDEVVLDGDRVVDASGDWRPARVAVEPSRRRPARWKPERALAKVPEVIADLAVRPGRAWLGVTTCAGAVTLPADWDPVAGRVRVSRDALTAVGAELPGAVCVTLDDSASRRPDEKIGVMLRGSGAVVDLDATAAAVAVDVSRVTYWKGFVSTSEDAAA
ncbi:MAG: hypothetical protein ACR2MN_01560 [Acidimicrobiales bacterium]